jgi:hypothetical protein
MNAELAQVFPAIALFIVSLVLTVGCLWAARRMAPWFIGQRTEVPSVRSFFLDPSADSDVSPARVVTILIAAVLVLAVLLAVTCVLRFGGLALV